MTTDIICIGHITHDHIVTPTTDIHMPGGTSFYFSYGLLHLQGCQGYRLITSLAKEDMAAVEDMRKAGIEVEVIPSPKTVYFENIYGENQDNRQQRVRSKAVPFSTDKLKNAHARYIVLGTLLADDFPLEALKLLSERGTLVVDAQGYLREVREENVFAVDWPQKHEALRYVDILKVNEWEIEVLTGSADQHQACRILAEWGVKEVLLTLGSYGSIIYAAGEFYEIPPYPPRKIVDATGCGDTYVMAYVSQRMKGATPSQAGHFASAVASLKLEESGPFHGSEADVMERLKSL